MPDQTTEAVRYTFK